MKFVVRWLFRLLILAIVLAVAAVLLKDTIFKEVLVGRLQRATGLETRLERAELALFSPTITLHGLRLFNRPEHGGGPLLVAPEVHCEYDRRALLSGELRLILLRVNIAELALVEDPAGGSNFRALQQRIARPGNPGLGPQFGGIDTLHLTLGQVRRIRLGTPGPGLTATLNLKGEIRQGLKTSAEIDRLLADLLSQAARLGMPGSMPAPLPSARPATNPPPAAPRRP